jgi:hypothetical protein
MIPSIRYLWQTPAITRQFKAAVSLHSHTQHSKESLEFVPRYAHRIPVLSYLVRHQEVRYQRHTSGRDLDFRNGWWTPPLGPWRAYDLERSQIETQLGLAAMVSLTDHDDIEAPMSLHVLPGMRNVPISVEWTVPYRTTFFHLGVHNLPLRWAQIVMERMTSFSTAPSFDDLPEVLSILHGFPSVLIVLNHPLWDELGVGMEAHRKALVDLILHHHEWIHALELNGLRSWSENCDVVRLASGYSLPVISGGDRHGRREANSILNLTSASTFSEFAAEVRYDRRSEVLFMPQSREPLKVRLLESIIDVLSDHGDLPEDRRRWTDRVYFRCEDGCIRQLSMLWKADGPLIVKLFVNAIRLGHSSHVRNALRTALAGGQEVPVS